MSTALRHVTAVLAVVVALFASTLTTFTLVQYLQGNPTVTDWWRLYALVDGVLWVIAGLLMSVAVLLERPLRR